MCRPDITVDSPEVVCFRPLRSLPSSQVEESCGLTSEAQWWTPKKLGRCQKSDCDDEYGIETDGTNQFCSCGCPPWAHVNKVGSTSSLWLHLLYPAAAQGDLTRKATHLLIRQNITSFIMFPLCKRKVIARLVIAFHCLCWKPIFKWWYSSKTPPTNQKRVFTQVELNMTAVAVGQWGVILFNLIKRCTKLILQQLYYWHSFLNHIWWYG